MIEWIVHLLKAMSNQHQGQSGRQLLWRFWRTASGYWRGSSSWRAWSLCLLLIAIVVGQLLTQYWLNFWNRDFFNALERKDSGALAATMLQFFPLIGLSIALAVWSVWGRMTTQRQWRRYVTIQLINSWLAQGRYRHLSDLNGDGGPRNSEYRIAEDARIATDAPIDLVLSLIASVLTAITFFSVLADVGGAMTVNLGGWTMTIPGYLVLGVILYSSLVTASMLWLGRRMASVVQEQVQAEAAFRASANLIRETGEGILVVESESQERKSLWATMHNVIFQWRNLCWQIMRTTVVTHGNTLLSPVAGLLLCAPKYLAGTMTLGEVTQAAAAFVVVQSAFNWFVDNFQRMADWRTAASRVGVLLHALDELERTEEAMSEASAPSVSPVRASA